MTTPLRIGVIGLGRRWRRRYQSALLALPARFTVQALYDQVAQRAEQEAQQLRCEASPSVTALVDRDDLDALILADAQWFGLWPVELACRFRKPIFCAVPLTCEEARAEGLVQQVSASRLPVMVEMLPRYAPATAQLRGLLQNYLGPVHLLICETVQARQEGEEMDIAWLDWCASLLESVPVSVVATSLESAGVTSQFWEFAAGWGLQLIQRQTRGARPACRLEVVAEQGSARVIPPRQVAWAGADGQHRILLPRNRPALQVQLEAFEEAVRAGNPTPEPSLTNAYRVLGWLRAARRSQAEGGRVSLNTL